MKQGTIAWGDPCVGLGSPRPRPLLIFTILATGNVGFFWISTAPDLADYVSITIKNTPSAFCINGGPLDSLLSKVQVCDDDGASLMVLGTHVKPQFFVVGSQIVRLTKMVTLNTTEWVPMRDKIARKLGLHIH